MTFRGTRDLFQKNIRETLRISIKVDPNKISVYASSVRHNKCLADAVLRSLRQDVFLNAD